MAFTEIPVTATYRLADGSVPTGEVRFTPTTTLRNLEPGLTAIIPPEPITAVVDSTGVVSCTLAATNDPDTTPTGATYVVEELFKLNSLGQLNRYLPTKSYRLEVGFNEAIIDLSRLAPRTEAPLGDLTSTATGVRTVHGTATAPFGTLTSTVAGFRVISGTGAAPLGALVSTSAGARTQIGTAAALLGALTSTAAGTVHTPVLGTAAAPLGALASTATGARTASGTAAAALGDLTSTATGQVLPPPSVRETHADEGNSSSPATVTLSANVEATDLIVVFEASESTASDLTFPAPPTSAGKTFSPIRIGANPASAAPMTALWLSTGFTGSETITSNSTDTDSVFLTVYVIEDGNCVVAATETNGDNAGTTHSAPSVPALAGDLLIGHWTCNLASAGANYSALGSGLSEDEHIVITNDCVHVTGHKAISSDGDTGTLDATFSASGSDYQGMSVVIRNSTAIRRNLCPNPALANDAEGWVSDDDGTWARVTADAGFERANAFGASDLTTGNVIDVRSARAPSTADEFYTLSASLYVSGADISSVGWNYASFTSESVISFNGSWAHAHPDGVVTRWSMGFMAPSTSVQVAINAFITSLPVGATEVQISDVRIEKYGWPDTIVYKDGDSDGWEWDEIAGSSTSSSET